MPNDDTYVDDDDRYQDAMRDYTRATTDKERDEALMVALWALTNLTDKIEQLREELVSAS